MTAPGTLVYAHRRCRSLGGLYALVSADDSWIGATSDVPLELAVILDLHTGESMLLNTTVTGDAANEVALWRP